MSRSKQFKSHVVAATVTRQEEFPCHAGYLVFGQVVPVVRDPVQSRRFHFIARSVFVNGTARGSPRKHAVHRKLFYTHDSQERSRRKCIQSTRDSDEQNCRSAGPRFLRTSRISC